MSLFWRARDSVTSIGSVASAQMPGQEQRDIRTASAPSPVVENHSWDGSVEAVGAARDIVNSH